MYFIYRINSSYDGFTPRRIPARLENGKYMIYNWKQYIDQLERGDIVFTFFTGGGFSQGIYLICKVVDINRLKKKVKGKVLEYNLREPIIPKKEFDQIKTSIFTRPRGSVFVIPPSVEAFFNRVLNQRILSEIEIMEKIDCKNCGYKDFRKCPIFDIEYIINWDKEVKLVIPHAKRIVAPFWIIPRQSWWMKCTYSEHIISKFFYAFKSGYALYARLFAEGIVVAIERNEHFKNVSFDFIVNVPLSPDKMMNGELDRVDRICCILSKLLKTRYLRYALELKKPISRRLYKIKGISPSTFVRKYFRYLKWRTRKSLNNKTILIVDDVVTEGKTLTAIAMKIHAKYPTTHIYVATGGIMAKKRNMTQYTIEKFERV